MTEPAIYSAEDPGAPPHLRAVAWMAQDGPGKHWTVTAATVDEAREKLRAFWLKCEAERPRKPPKVRIPAVDGSELQVMGTGEFVCDVIDRAIAQTLTDEDPGDVI